MRIAFVIIECKKEGGQDQYVYELIRHLAAAGHEITLYSQIAKELPESIKHYYIPAPGRIGLLRFFSFFCFSTFRVWLDRNRYDIIHGAGGNVFGANVTTAHYCHPAWQQASQQLPAIRQGWRRWYDRILNAVADWLDRLVYQSSHTQAVIAVSQATKKDLLSNYQISPEQISVIYNGVNIDRFHPRNRARWRESIRTKYQIPAEIPVLLFVGAFERKGLGYLIEALSYLTEPAILLVAGSGQLAAQQAHAEQLGVGKKIIWLGQVSEVEQYYAAADLFIFPTLYEPFGLVVTEAMASGLPVITSASAGAAELIEPGQDGWLLNDPTDARELAATIGSVLADRAKLAQIGDRARQKACQYHWQQTAEQTAEIYQSLPARAIAVAQPKAN